MPEAPHTLPLNSVFGPTYQGEGPHTGTRCHFIRLGQCQLSCTWCDTPDTWDHTRYDVAAENPWTPIETILDRLDALPPAPRSTSRPPSRSPPSSRWPPR